MASSSEVQKLVYRLTAQSDQLQRDLNRAQGKLRSFQKQSNTVTSAIRSQFVGMFGATAVLYGVQRLTSNTIDLVKRTDTLNKALTAVTGTEEELARSREFLSRISEQYGIEIENLTKSYTKFIASSKGTALEGKKAEDIFMKVSKASAVMGLSVDETDGVLKALGQIMSKGKVQAEELRGQLGDRLPGAFNIMAQAIGVTTGELDKMLKDGKLMADEVLPAFADQMLKTYGAEQVGRVDTMVAAHNRFTNAWKELMQEVDNGEGVISETYKSFYEGLTSVFTLLKEANRETISWGTALLGIINPFGAINAHTEIAIANFKKTQKETLNASEAQRLYNLGIENGRKSFEDFKNLEPERIISELADKTEVLSQVQSLYNTATDEAAKKQQAFQEQLKKTKLEMDSMAESIRKAIGTQAAPSLDYTSAAQGLSNATPEDQRFDSDIAGMMGFPSAEEVQEYFEEVKTISSSGWGSMNEIWANGQKEMEGITINFNKILDDAIGSVVDTIGAGGDIEDVFADLLGVIGEGLVSLGRTLVAYGVALEAFIKADPVTKIIAGAAAIALGTAFTRRSAKLSDSVAGSSGGGYSSRSGGFQNNISGQTLNIELAGSFRFNGRDFEAAVDKRIKEKSRLGG
jgi:tape measure domain-containing protein